jgi:ABC-2 type transport system ATP-binding protein
MLTTHDLADVERLCRRIIFIDKGTVLYDGPVDELKRRYAPYRMLDITLTPDPDGEGERSPIALGIAGVEIVEQTTSRLLVRFDPDEVAITDLITAIISRHPVLDIAIVEPDLEGVVREIVEAGEMR